MAQSVTAIIIMMAWGRVITNNNKHRAPSIKQSSPAQGRCDGIVVIVLPLSSLAAVSPLSPRPLRLHPVLRGGGGTRRRPCLFRPCRLARGLRLGGQRAKTHTALTHVQQYLRGSFECRSDYGELQLFLGIPSCPCLYKEKAPHFQTQVRWGTRGSECPVFAQGLQQACQKMSGM